MNLWGLFLFLSPQMVTKITIQGQGERKQREQMLVLSLVHGNRSVSLPLRMLSIMVSSLPEQQVSWPTLHKEPGCPGEAVCIIRTWTLAPSLLLRKATQL